jgi:hypothetical protein
MGNMCMSDDRSKRLKRRRERERLVGSKYRSFQQSPDEKRQINNGKLESGFAESEKCHRCHSKFNVVRRRHHCRRCKNSFCSSHSSREANAFAILQEKGESDPNIPTAAVAPNVRVCDNCFYRLARKSDGSSSWL